MLLVPIKFISNESKKVSESEQIWRRHKIYVPQLVEVRVPNSNRIGKAWV